LPVGTSLLVATAGPIDLTAPRTYAGTLALPARYRGQELAPVQSEVVLEVAAPQAMGPRNAVFASLSVTAVTIDGKRVAVKTQPMMRPISANGQALPGSGTLPANTRLTFVVVP
jgi:hypothetical protein